MKSSFFEKFRRVTASTAYLPEIDGLRFLAVFWVAIIMHTMHYLDEKFYNNQLIHGVWRLVVLEGVNGMHLFFVISGFILSLPFARMYLNNKEKVSLKRYYLRRLTRLEPPYLIALFLFFIGHVFIIKKFAVGQLIPSFFASIFYSHGLIYDRQPLIMPVAWSLEIEVQFYILAPLFCLLFKIPSRLLRRAALVILAITSVLCSSFTTNLLLFLHYFIIGLLLADLYVSKDAKVENSKFSFVMGVLALVALISIPSYYWHSLQYAKVLLLFIVCYQVLFNSQMKTMFSGKGITLIGGMCYSIYLLHFGIISCFGAIMLSRNTSFDYNYAPLYLIAITLLILLLSAGYFYYIEKPFMKFRLKRLEQKTKKETFI
ncbi:acyltransferase family protein [Flavisolibacter tropicus]|uniref:Acyltransferase 3 domain-containing protein n=1 Tax=Flavisolibacter tropicus TaxID=1492898 RepID=A0A172TVX2_9BACT|nr:acyltransferase [Flavisolibacter tropicus]ANE51142.1 hypothetical protein SY85_12150 [Flavisolibacter tropicus]